MRFYLTKRETTHHAVKRIFTDLIKINISLLITEGENVDKAVHDARKNFKKLRAVLRLVRSDIQPNFYKTHNVHFRNLSRKIAGLRDSFVIIEALQNLIKNNKEETTEFDELINSLKEEYFETKNKILFEENQPQNVVSSLEFSLEEFNDLPKIKDGFSTLGEGIEKIYSKGKYFLQLTYTEPNSEVFHEWRKNVKYLWHMLQIIQPINYYIIKKLTTKFKKLSDFIGDDHDLHELKNVLISKKIENPELLEMINIKQFELRSKAWKLGEELYQKTPNAFVEDLQVYYDKWKK